MRFAPRAAITAGVLLAGLACAVSTQPVILSPLPTVTVQPEGEIEVYFTEPTNPAAADFRGGPDAALAAAIDAARSSVDVAIYKLDLWSIRDALIGAHRRGVQVRVVAESDNLGEREMQQLIAAGIPVVDDRRAGRMHNKFVVIDGYEVWSGSMNFTVNGAYRNNNDLIRLRSTRLAENYQTEFDEMFTAGLFGEAVGFDTPYPSLSLNGVRVENYFSPDDGVAARIVALIGKAQESVVFAAFSFASDAIAEAMIAQARRGVVVSGVFEEEQYRSNQGGEFDGLRSAGLDVRLDGNVYNMHHKFIVIDGQVVITGSYNFSRSAEERNDENVLVIYDPAIAAQYLDEFERLMAIGDQ